MVTSIPFLIAKVADDNDFFRLKEMANVHDDWNLDYDKCGVRIWSKPVSDAAVKMVKIRSTFSELNPSDLYNTLLDASYRKEWDPHMMISYDIGHLNPNNGISYYAVSCPPPLRSRDFVLQSSWLDRGKEHFIINHSVCHKDHPPRKNFIRAISYFTGYFIECNLTGCEMSFVTQTDPQGLIPTWLVNKCTQILAPKFIKQLERAAIKYSEWKKINNPNYCPWIYPEQITSPKITVQDCVPCDDEIKSAFFRYLLEKLSKRTSSRRFDNSRSISNAGSNYVPPVPENKTLVRNSNPVRKSMQSQAPEPSSTSLEKSGRNKVKLKKSEKKELKEKAKEEKKKEQMNSQKKKGKRTPTTPTDSQDEEVAHK